MKNSVLTAQNPLALCLKNAILLLKGVETLAIHGSRSDISACTPKILSVGALYQFTLGLQGGRKTGTMYCVFPTLQALFYRLGSGKKVNINRQTIQEA